MKKQKFKAYFFYSGLTVMMLFLSQCGSAKEPRIYSTGAAQARVEMAQDMLLNGKLDLSKKTVEYLDSITYHETRIK